MSTRDSNTHVATEAANFNVRRWESGDYVDEFANRVLRPVEVVILARYREAFSGRVLELGCGAGRLIGYLLALGAETHGVDVSPRMVRYCRARYPQASVVVGDMTRLGATAQAQFDAVIAGYNVLDVLQDGARRQVLSDVHARLAPGGLLVFSSHNLASVDVRPEHGGAVRSLSRLDRRPSELLALAMRLPARLRNRRRLAALQRREPDHAILNDSALDYALLHYYIGRDDQARQLEQLGYDLVECLDLEATPVGAGEVSRCPELHYVARRSAG